MPADARFLLLVAASLALPLLLFAVRPDLEPGCRFWTRDPHLRHFQARLAAPEDPPVVFFGASGVMNDVAPLEIGAALGRSGSRALNLGVNWMGMDEQAVLVEAWLDRKKPAQVFLEAPFLLRYYAHPNFEKTARARDLARLSLRAPWMALPPAIVYGPRLLYQAACSSLDRAPFADPYGRLPAEGHVRIPLTAEQERAARKDAAARLALGQRPPDDPAGAAHRLYRAFRYAHHDFFLERISAACRARGVRLVLLGLPQQGVNAMPEGLARRYAGLGDLRVPPPDLLQRPDVWRDQGHLNWAGARLLAPWLAGIIAEKTP